VPWEGGGCGRVLEVAGPIQDSSGAGALLQPGLGLQRVIVGLSGCVGLIAGEKALNVVFGITTRS